MTVLTEESANGSSASAVPKTSMSAEASDMSSRGSPEPWHSSKPTRLGKGVRQLIQAPRREHSRKPDEQYGRIEALVGGPYCELFSRRPRLGWQGWGNEYPTFETLAEQAVAAR